MSWQFWKTRTVARNNAGNATRRQAALNAVRASSNYKSATRAGLNNAGAQKYYANIQAWRSGMPRGYGGQDQTNAAQEFKEWELTHPKPLLPGEAPNADLVGRKALIKLQEQAKGEQAARESHGNFRGGRKSRKNRKNRKSRR
jgi:hypothetical protein